MRPTKIHDLVFEKIDHSIEVMVKPEPIDTQIETRKYNSRRFHARKLPS